MPARATPPHRTLAPAVAATALLLLPPAARAIDFDFSYADPDGQGFFDPVAGEQRRAALQEAGRIIGSLIRPTHADESVTVRVSTVNNPNPASILGSARPAFFYGNFGSADPRYQSDTHYAKALASHLAGHDVQNTHVDIAMTVNLSQPFYFGTDNNAPANQFDFVALALHEIIHGLGFNDSFRQQGGYGVYGDGSNDTPTGVSGFPTIYDRFVTSGPNGTPLLSLSTSNRSTALTSGNVFWNGANGTTGNAGNAPRLNAPATFSGGSSIAHLDANTFAADIMSPTQNLGPATQTVSSVTRGILRDLGWNISVNASTVDWTYAGPGNRASTPSNWSQNPMPGDRVRFAGASPAAADIKMDLQLYQFDEIEFRPGATAHTLRLRSFTNHDLTGAGITNSPANPRHTFILETYSDDLTSPDPIPAGNIGRAATMTFRNAASAGSTDFQIHSGFTEIRTAPNVPPSYNRYYGASVAFRNTSTAATASFAIQGASGDGAHTTYAHVQFYNASTAGAATFTTQPGRIGPGLTPFGNVITVAGFGGRLVFHDTASAGTATVTNQGQADAPSGSGTAGITTFTDNSTAASATFNNLPATHFQGSGGLTQFLDNSTAATATFNNTGTGPGGGGPGTTDFSGNASAGSATFNNLGGSGIFTPGGLTVFRGSSTAAAAAINNLPTAPGTAGFAGSTEFRDDANAGTATITNPVTPREGFLNFHDRASASSATITLPSPPTPGGGASPINFRNASSAGSATFNYNTHVGTGTTFYHTSTAGNANFNFAPRSGHTVAFQDSSTAGSATFNMGTGAAVRFNASSSAASATFIAGSDAGVSFGGSFNTAGLPTVTAASATFHLLGHDNAPTATYGGHVNFANWSTAGNATFHVGGAQHASSRPGTVALEYGATGGTATFHLNASTIPGAPGGQLYFRFGATAPDARVITQAGTYVDVSLNRVLGYGPGPAAIGSLTGPATVNLEGATLVLGVLGLDDTLSGNVIDASPSFSGHLVKTGAGTLTLSGNNNYKGTTTVSQGTLRLLGSQSIPTAYAVSPGASLEFLSPRTISTLSGQGAVTVAAPLQLSADSPASTLASLTLTPTGSLDLTNNPLTLSLTPSAARQLILSSQLTSSTPDPTNTLSLAYAPSNASTLIELTLTGDANLDGSLTPDDFALLDRGFATSGQLWSDGDFNYDAQVDQNDYLLIDRAYLLTKAQGWQSLGPSLLSLRASQFGHAYVSQLLTSLPEPSSLSLLLTTLPLLSRTRGKPKLYN